MKLEALYNAVIVKPKEAEETSYGGIIVPDLGSSSFGKRTGKDFPAGWSNQGHHLLRPS